VIGHESRLAVGGDIVAGAHESKRVMTRTIRRAIAVALWCSVNAGLALAESLLVLNHVNVIDVRDGRISKNVALVIKDGKISQTISSGAAPSANAVVLDARGKFAIPGLWDLHYHFDDSEPGLREYNLLIANGVLGIRDMGDKPEKIFPARDEVASGRVLGPCIIACGPIIDGPQPTNPPLSVSVSGPADARATVRRIQAMGSQCVKVHDGVPLDAYHAVADEARRVGLPLVGHVPVRVHVREAVKAGQRSIEHQIGLRGASTVEDEVMELERTNDVFAEAMRTRNFPLIPESIAKKGNYVLDHLDDERTHDLFRTFARNRTYLCPTLVTDYALTYVDDLNAKDDPRMKYIPARQREWWNPERGMLTRYRTPAYIAFRKRQYATTLRLVPVAQRDGVRFLAGTDSTLPFIYPGFSVHDEMAQFVKAGLSPLQALQTATLHAAAFLGLEDSAGTLEKGKDADIVLLDANPLQDIKNTKAISAVVVHGRLVRREDLDGMLKAAEEAARRSK
jgi:imidazolonepropionase-like amidohydrolase